MNLHLRAKEHFPALFTSAWGPSTRKIGPRHMRGPVPERWINWKKEWSLILRNSWTNSFSFCRVYATKCVIVPETFVKRPKSSNKLSFRPCFNLFSQNHQLRTITNLGHHTLEKRKFQNFQKMVALQFFTFATVHRIVLDEKKQFWPMLGLFRPQILSPNSLEIAIFDKRILLAISEGFYVLLLCIKQTINTLKGREG